MKKISLLIGLLVIVFAATAYAQPVEFKMSGFTDVLFAVFRNIPAGSGGFQSFANFEGDVPDPLAGVNDKSGAIADSRARLKFQANVGKELSATIFLEMDSATWGDANGTRNSMGYWNADRAAVEVKHAFFDVAVPYFGVAVPISLRFGVQPFAIRDTWYMYTDGAGVMANFKLDPVSIRAFWAKPYEGKVYASDDADVYAIDVSGTVEGFTLGGHGAYWNINEYPLPTTATAVGTQAAAQADMYWLGAYADGNYAGFNFNFDFIYDGGKVRPAVGDDTKLGGWIGALKASFPWENFDFGGGAWYATGANATSEKNKAYLQPPGSEPGPNAFNQYGSVFFGPGSWRGEHATAANGSHSEAIGNNIGGTWGALLYAGMKVTPWYKVYLNATYFADTTKNGNTVGNAHASGGGLRDDNGIGLEFTLSNYFQIYKNLTADFIAGYLITGDAMDMWDGTKNHSIDDPYLIGSRLVYSF